MQTTALPVAKSQGLLGFLVSHLPKAINERVKRTIFVFSVLAVLDKTATPCEATIRDVNERLRLARTDGICKSSAKAHADIWQHTEIDGTTYNNDLPAFSASTNRVERELLVEYYVRHCPQWLRYGISDHSDMSRDLNRLFNAITTRGT